NFKGFLLSFQGAAAPHILVGKLHHVIHQVTPIAGSVKKSTLVALDVLLSAPIHREKHFHSPRAVNIFLYAVFQAHAIPSKKSSHSPGQVVRKSRMASW